MHYAAGAGAAAAAIAQAIKASGAIVAVEPDEFTSILSRVEKPLVIVSRGGFIKKDHRYLISYKGFVFFTKSPSPLHLSSDSEIIAAKNIWIPM